MAHPNFERARHYVLGRLERELAPTLYYHNIAHTRDDVLPAAERLATLAGLGAEDRLLLCTAALFHDVGFVEMRQGHEQVSVRIAAAVLPDFGFAPAQVAAVCQIIMATQLPALPQDPLGALLADADLDALGRDDFFARQHALRTEMAAYGTTLSDEDWYRAQLHFLENHRYFTAPARTLRDTGKRAHIAALRELLDGALQRGP